MGDYLRGFLIDKGYAVKHGFLQVAAKNCGGSQWILATQSIYKSVDTDVVLPKFVKNARDEAYILKVS